MRGSMGTGAVYLLRPVCLIPRSNAEPSPSAISQGQGIVAMLCSSCHVLFRAQYICDLTSTGSCHALHCLPGAIQTLARLQNHAHRGTLPLPCMSGCLEQHRAQCICNATVTAEFWHALHICVPGATQASQLGQMVMVHTCQKCGLLRTRLQAALLCSAPALPRCPSAPTVDLASSWPQPCLSLLHRNSGHPTTCSCPQSRLLKLCSGSSPTQHAPLLGSTGQPGATSRGNLSRSFQAMAARARRRSARWPSLDWEGRPRSWCSCRNSRCHCSW